MSQYYLFLFYFLDHTETELMQKHLKGQNRLTEYIFDINIIRNRKVLFCLALLCLASQCLGLATITAAIMTGKSGHDNPYKSGSGNNSSLKMPIIFTLPVCGY